MCIPVTVNLSRRYHCPTTGWWWGGGAGQGKASNQGEGIDEFVFQISQDEFLDFMFEDLALPNLIRKQLKDTLS